MRKQDSLFNAVVKFVNEQPIGSTFSTQEYLNRVSGFESSTSWKRLTRNTNYRAHTYKGMLKKYFLTNPKRGSWTVTRHIPDWFTAAHLWTLNWYTTSSRYDNKTKKWTNTNRTKMTRDEIIAKLNIETNTDIIFHKMANSIADESVIGNKTPEDPMFYASGTYTLEKAIEGIPDKKIVVISGTSEIVPQIKVTKVEKEDSQFFSNNNTLESQDILNNIRENIGLVRAATHIIDQVRVTDPYVHGRVVNIFEQLNSLLISMDDRLHSKISKPKF